MSPAAHPTPTAGPPAPSDADTITQAPRPIEFQKIQQDPKTLVFSFREEAGELLDGLFAVFYQRAGSPSDVPSLYTFLTRIGYFRHGLMQGTWRAEYVQPGTGLNYTETYKDGLINGPLTVYNADKTIHYQAALENGTGRWKSFYATGRPELEGDYRAGREHGTWLRYGPDGRIEEQLVYDNGTLLRTIPAQ